jgi:hypothetical protein
MAQFMESHSEEADIAYSEKEAFTDSAVQENLLASAQSETSVVIESGESAEAALVLPAVVPEEASSEEPVHTEASATRAALRGSMVTECAEVVVSSPDNEGGRDVEGKTPIHTTQEIAPPETEASGSGSGRPPEGKKPIPSKEGPEPKDEGPGHIQEESSKSSSETYDVFSADPKSALTSKEDTEKDEEPKDSNIDTSREQDSAENEGPQKDEVPSTQEETSGVEKVTTTTETDDEGAEPEVEVEDVLGDGRHIIVTGEVLESRYEEPVPKEAPTNEGSKPEISDELDDVGEQAEKKELDLPESVASVAVGPEVADTFFSTEEGFIARTGENFLPSPPMMIAMTTKNRVGDGVIELPEGYDTEKLQAIARDHLNFRQDNVPLTRQLAGELADLGKQLWELNENHAVSPSLNDREKQSLAHFLKTVGQAGL